MTHQPWDGSPSRFTDEQYAMACVLDRGPGVKGKDRYSLPIREPDGTLSTEAASLAAGRLSGSEATPEQKDDARRRLVAAFGQIGKESPLSLAAGPTNMTAHDAAFVSDMLHVHHRIVDQAHSHRARGGHPSVMRFAASVLGSAQQNTSDAANMLPDGKGTPQGPSDYAY